MQRFHDAAVAAGGASHDAPRRWTLYRRGDFYAIVRDLDLLRPIYRQTAAYGHFGRPEMDFTWEATTRVEALKGAVAR